MTPLAAARLILADADGSLAPDATLEIAGARCAIFGDVMVVRGTDGWSDWTSYNFAAWPRRGDTAWLHAGALYYGQVAYAFAKDKDIAWVVGHSLGGGAAQIVAPSLGIRGYAFNSLPVLYSRSAKPSRLIAHNCRFDLVSWVPPWCRFWAAEVVWHPGRDHRMTRMLELLEAAG